MKPWRGLQAPSGCRIETRLDACRSERMRIRRYITLQRGKSVETNLDAADMNVRATIYAEVLFRCSVLARECIYENMRLGLRNHRQLCGIPCGEASGHLDQMRDAMLMQ